MKNFWNNNKEFRVFAWTVLNATIAFVGTQLLNIDWPNAVVVAWIAIPFLNAFTKYANTKRFGDLWVKK